MSEIEQIDTFLREAGATCRSCGAPQTMRHYYLSVTCRPPKKAKYSWVNDMVDVILQDAVKTKVSDGKIKG